MKWQIRSKIGQNLGSGTILALGLALGTLSALLASNLAVFGLISVEKLRVQADQIAVAVADSARGLITGYPCQTAEQMATMYMVLLDTCRIVGFDSFIRLRSAVVGIEIEASSRAGAVGGN